MKQRRTSFTSAVHAGDPRGFGMNPIDKFRYHGVFPCKLFLNLLIVCMTGALLLVYEVPLAAYQHNQKLRLTSRFMPSSYFSVNDDLTGIGDVRELVRQTVSQYYNGINDEVNKFSPLADESGVAAKPVMVATIGQRSLRFTRTDDDDDTSTAVSLLTLDDPLGLLDTTLVGDVKFDQLPQTRHQMDALCAPRLDWWSGDWYNPCRGYSYSPTMQVSESMTNMKDDSIKKVMVSFELIATDANVPFQSREATYLWKVLQTFDFHSGSGELTANVKLSGERLGSPAAMTLRELLAIALLVCCAWDMMLRLRVFHRFRRFHSQHPFLQTARESYKLFGTEEDGIAITLEPSGTTELTPEALAEEKQEEEEFTRWLEAAETRESNATARNSSRRSRRSSRHHHHHHHHRRRTASKAHRDADSSSPDQSQRTISSSKDLAEPPRSVRFVEEELLKKEEENKRSDERQKVEVLEGPPKGTGQMEEKDASTDSSWTTSSSYSSESDEHSDLGFHSMSEKFHKERRSRKDRQQSRLERRNRVINVNTMGAKWMVLGIVSELFLVSGCIMLLLDLHRGDQSRPLDYDHVRQILLGMGVMLNSILLLSYFRHSPRYYFLIEAMSRGMPRVFVFIVINVMPIFFSFAFFGVIVFGSFVPELSSITQTSISLVSVIGGDSLVKLFDSASATNNLLLLWAARLFYVSFVCMFIYGVLNVTLAIVQDSYYFVKRKLYIMRDLEGKQALRDAYRNYKRQLKNDRKSTSAMASS